MPKLTIDSHEIEVADGTTVIQAAEELGIFIPRYCYHPGLSIAGPGSSQYHTPSSAVISHQRGEGTGVLARLLARAEPYPQ